MGFAFWHVLSPQENSMVTDGNGNGQESNHLAIDSTTEKIQDEILNFKIRINELYVKH